STLSCLLPTTLPLSLSLHDALPISIQAHDGLTVLAAQGDFPGTHAAAFIRITAQHRRLSGIKIQTGHVGVQQAVLALITKHVNRSEEHTSELQSPDHLVCRLLLEKK